MILTLTNPKNNETLTSAFATDDGAAKVLAPHAAGNEFVASLLDAYQRFGNLTPGRKFWLHKLATERVTPVKPAAPTTAAPAVNVLAAIEMMDHAAQTLQHPRLRFALPGDRKVEMVRCGDGSRTPGAIHITDGGKYGANKWYGRIDRDGTFVAGRDRDPVVEAFLAEFAADPKFTCAKYGRKTGRCCFCGDKLTRGKRATGEALYSTDLGYGPVCAKNHNMPWGKHAAELAKRLQAAE